MSLHLPEVTCQTCGAICMRYQRVRSWDDNAKDELGVTVGDLLDVLVFSCGGIVTRGARRKFRQPQGGNGFVDYDVESRWDTLRTCSEAERIVRELREKQG